MYYPTEFESAVRSEIERSSSKYSEGRFSLLQSDLSYNGGYKDDEYEGRQDNGEENYHVLYYFDLIDKKRKNHLDKWEFWSFIRAFKGKLPTPMVGSTENGEDMSRILLLSDMMVSQEINNPANIDYEAFMLNYLDTYIFEINYYLKNDVYSLSFDTSKKSGKNVKNLASKILSKDIKSEERFKADIRDMLKIVRAVSKKEIEWILDKEESLQR